MILIHKEKHQIIIIDKVRPDKDLIIYSIYEKNDGIKLNQIISQRPTNELSAKLKETINFYEFAYQILATELVDFEVSEDLQNWKLPTAIRLVIPNKLRTQARFEANNLDALFQGIITTNANADTKFLFYSKNVAIAYFQTILPEHLSILQPYLDSGEIIKENRNV